ncbi:MAG: hypothetical protein AMXMBFR83_23510 [Phycisphaerae bacterium]
MHGLKRPSLNRLVKPRRLFPGAVYLCWVAAGLPAGAQPCDPPGHLDVAIALVDGGIVTGLADYIGQPSDPKVWLGVKVWGARFQSDPLNPLLSDDPGLTALSGSGLPAGSQVGFDVLDDLTYWDGQGPIRFGPVPDHEQLRIRLAGQSRFVGTGTGMTSGFFFASASASGSIHVHLSFFLLGADGNAVPATQDGVEPTPGVYLLKLRLKSNLAEVGGSEPLFIVFDNAAGGCAHCVALVYTASRLAKDRPAADLDFDRDVDADDLARFAICAGGPAIPWIDPCCQSADLDGDGDVDQNDYARLQRCLGGPGVPAPIGCAD